MSELSIVFIGDVVGRPGRLGVCQAIPVLREKYAPDLIIANGENSAGGSGITPSTFQKLTSYGVDVLTSGDHIFRNRDFPGIIKESRVLRPANYPKAADGKGWGIYETKSGARVAVINLIGRIFMEPMRCPFEIVDEILLQIKDQTKIILVDMHAEATSEKIAMGWHLDGRVSAVLGTHTHVQTADERILPMGTACLTDAGMTGSHKSVIGREVKPVLKKLRTGMPARFDVAEENVKVCGAALKIETPSGIARSIERFQLGPETLEKKIKS